MEPVPKIPDSELLAMAVEFAVGYEPFVNGNLFDPTRYPSENKNFLVYVRNMGNRDSDGPDKWAILRHSFCLSKSGQWTYQSMPSSRTNNFYTRCRYDSVEEAITYYRRWHAACIEWAKKKLAKAKEGERVVFNYEDVPRGRIKF